MPKKLVFREDLQFVIDELFFIKLAAPENLQDQIENLTKYIDTKILESDKNNINELKRIYYKAMKEAKTPEENKRYYEMYKGLDNLLEDKIVISGRS